MSAANQQVTFHLTAGNRLTSACLPPISAAGFHTVITSEACGEREAELQAPARNPLRMRGMRLSGEHELRAQKEVSSAV